MYILFNIFLKIYISQADFINIRLELIYLLSFIRNTKGML